MKPEESPAIAKFRTYLESHKASDQTIARYLPVAKDFLKSAGGQSGWTKENVRLFLAAKSKKGLKGSYLRFLFTSLKAFFRAVDVTWPFDKRDLPVVSEPEVRYYEFPEVQLILNASAARVAAASEPSASPDKRLQALLRSATGIDTTAAYMQALRNFLLLKVCAVTGCRRIELTTLSREHYDPKAGRLFIRPAKHGRPVWRKLDGETVKWLNEYLQMRRDRHHPLFLSIRHGGERRLDEKTLNAVLETACKAAGVENKGWHAFRRGLVTTLYEGGAREKDITAWMGWKKSDTVLRYIQRLPPAVEKTIVDASPYYQEDKS